MIHRLLIVDDEINILNALRRALAQSGGRGGELNGWTIETFTSPGLALQRATYVSFDVVLSDYRMPELDGVMFLREMREVQPDSTRLIMSGCADMTGLIGAINDAEVFRFVEKPWNTSVLREILNESLTFREAVIENRRLADMARVKEGSLSIQDMELRRLEEKWPGITKVSRLPDGSVLLDLTNETEISRKD